MRKTLFVFVLVAFVLMAVSAVTFAQEPPPDEHNFCLNGTWFCPDPDDPAREEWNWAAAWYWALYRAGEIPFEKIPEWARNIATTCQITIDAAGATAIGLSNPTVEVPLDVIYGLFDPNATVGATPYGFDWDGGGPVATGDTVRPMRGLGLSLLGPTSGYFLWDMGGRGWNPDIVANNCPTPNPPYAIPLP